VRPGPSWAGTPNRQALRGTGNALAGTAAGPADCGAIKALALPPLRIAPGGVHGRLETARQCLAELIACHQQPLAMRGACSMKFKLFPVRLVVFETVPSYKKAERQ